MSGCHRHPDSGDIRPRRAARVLLRGLRRRWRDVARLAAWSPVEALPAMLSGLLTARAVDQGFLADRPALGLGWLGVLMGAVLVGAYGTFRVHRCLAGVVEPFRDDLLRYALASALYRSTTAAGGRADTASVARVTHQVEIVRDTYAGLIMVVRGFGFAATGALLGMLSLSPVVVLLVAPPLLVGLALFALALPVMVGWQHRYVLADEDLAETAGSVVHGRRDVVACGAEPRARAAVGRRVDAQAGAERALATMAAVRGVCLAVGGWLPLVVLLVATPWLVERGMTTGAVLGALVYVLHGLQPPLYALLRGLGGGGLRLLVTLDRLLTMGAPPLAIGATGAAAPAAPPGRAGAPGGPVPGPPGGRPTTGAPPHPAAARVGLVLHRVTFGYGPHAEPVVRELDLAVAPGEHLAVVGPSGIGKSTLAGLMAGTLRPQTGLVRLDGRPVDALSPAALAHRRVLIPQEAYVFTGTLWDNLTYLRPRADRGAVDEVVNLLGLVPLVSRLGGYHRRIDPGNLSAGERQSLALARAYLSPAWLVLLDEATCHLDPVTEARIEQAFANRSGAMVVVAHRISSALRARRVLVLNGAEVALGHHDRLLASSASYRELVGHWRGQPGPEHRAGGHRLPTPTGQATT